MSEVDRIKEAYIRRTVKRGLYSMFNTGALFAIQQRERAILEALKRCEIQDLSSLRILEIGSGNGAVLRDFISYGALPKNLTGIDLLEDRIAEARRFSPEIQFVCSNAEELPFETSCYDMVLFFTVFSSILDIQMRKRLIENAGRVLRPQGIIICYDYRFDNPNNPDVKGIKRKEFEDLFEAYSLDIRSTTLAPPLARLTTRISWPLSVLLETIPFLRTHYLVVGSKI